MKLLRNYLMRLVKPMVEGMVDERMNGKLAELEKQITEIDGLAASILLEVKNAKRPDLNSDRIIERLEIKSSTA
jgi:hypothetical protein